jgi:hypothetical protein
MRNNSRLPEFLGPYLEWKVAIKMNTENYINYG